MSAVDLSPRQHLTSLFLSTKTRTTTPSSVSEPTCHSHQDPVAVAAHPHLSRPSCNSQSNRTSNTSSLSIQFVLLPPASCPATNKTQRKDELEYWLTEHLRLNGIYWGLTALHLMGRGDALPRDETIEFVLSCQHDNGGFGAAPGHDAHLLSTVSAVQILAMVDALEELEKRGRRGGKMGVGKCTFCFPCRCLMHGDNRLLMFLRCRSGFTTKPRCRHFCWR